MFQREESKYGKSVVVVFGGREFNNKRVLFRKMDKFHARYQFDFVVAGGATGADTLAIDWAKSRGIPYEESPADWSNLKSKPCKIKTGKHGPYNALAGLARNQSMLSVFRPHYAVAFPGGTGTADMVQRVKVNMAFGITDKLITVTPPNKG